MQAFVSLNWVLAEEAFDLETELAFGFLDYLMLGTSAAPLRRALNESGLGESLIGGGLSDDLRQPIFSLGLKGVEPANAEKVSFDSMTASARHADRRMIRCRIAGNLHIGWVVRRSCWR